MHELALTQSILNIALAEAAGRGAVRVLEIRIKVGALAGVLPDLVQEYFGIVSADTLAGQARLIIERAPAALACLDCGANCDVDGFVFACPACGSSRIRLDNGREFYVESLEIEC